MGRHVPKLVSLLISALFIILPFSISDALAQGSRELVPGDYVARVMFCSSPLPQESEVNYIFSVQFLEEVEEIKFALFPQNPEESQRFLFVEPYEPDDYVTLSDDDVITVRKSGMFVLHASEDIKLKALSRPPHENIAFLPTDQCADLGLGIGALYVKNRLQYIEEELKPLETLRELNDALYKSFQAVMDEEVYLSDEDLCKDDEPVFPGIVFCGEYEPPCEETRLGPLGTLICAQSDPSYFRDLFSSRIGPEADARFQAIKQDYGNHFNIPPVDANAEFELRHHISDEYITRVLNPNTGRRGRNIFRNWQDSIVGLTDLRISDEIKFLNELLKSKFTVVGGTEGAEFGTIADLLNEKFYGQDLHFELKTISPSYERLTINIWSEDRKHIVDTKKGTLTELAEMIRSQYPEKYVKPYLDSFKRDVVRLDISKGGKKIYRLYIMAGDAESGHRGSSVPLNFEMEPRTHLITIRTSKLPQTYQRAYPIQIVWALFHEIGHALRLLDLENVRNMRSLGSEEIKRFSESLAERFAVESLLRQHDLLASKGIDHSGYDFFLLEKPPATLHRITAGAPPQRTSQYKVEGPLSLEMLEEKYGRDIVERILTGRAHPGIYQEVGPLLEEIQRYIRSPDGLTRDSFNSINSARDFRQTVKGDYLNKVDSVLEILMKRSEATPRQLMESLNPLIEEIKGIEHYFEGQYLREAKLYPHLDPHQTFKKIMVSNCREFTHRLEVWLGRESSIIYGDEVIPQMYSGELAEFLAKLRKIHELKLLAAEDLILISEGAESPIRIQDRRLQSEFDSRGVNDLIKRMGLSGEFFEALEATETPIRNYWGMLNRGESPYKGKITRFLTSSPSELIQEKLVDSPFAGILEAVKTKAGLFGSASLAVFGLLEALTEIGESTGAYWAIYTGYAARALGYAFLIAIGGAFIKQIAAISISTYALTQAGLGIGAAIAAGVVQFAAALASFAFGLLIAVITILAVKYAIIALYCIFFSPPDNELCGLLTPPRRLLRFLSEGHTGKPIMYMIHDVSEFQNYLTGDILPVSFISAGDSRKIEASCTISELSGERYPKVCAGEITTYLEPGEYEFRAEYEYTEIPPWFSLIPAAIQQAINTGEATITFGKSLENYLLVFNGNEICVQYQEWEASPTEPLVYWKPYCISVDEQFSQYSGSGGFHISQYDERYSRVSLTFTYSDSLRVSCEEQGILIVSEYSQNCAEIPALESGQKTGIKSTQTAVLTMLNPLTGILTVKTPSGEKTSEEFPITEKETTIKID